MRNELFPQHVEWTHLGFVKYQINLINPAISNKAPRMKQTSATENRWLQMRWDTINTCTNERIRWQAHEKDEINHTCRRVWCKRYSQSIADWNLILLWELLGEGECWGGVVGLEINVNWSSVLGRKLRIWNYIFALMFQGMLTWRSDTLFHWDETNLINWCANPMCRISPLP